VDTRAPSFTFQLDDASNSGATSDRITSDDTPTISGTGTVDDIIVVTFPGSGEALSTTVDANGQWSITPSLTVASGSVSVLARNSAGASSLPQTLALTIDKSVAQPSLALVCDSGFSASDRISQSAELVISGLENGASLSYSTNGTAWASTFTATEGLNTVYVRQTDVAGNVATSSALTFTLDTTAPLPTLSVESIFGDDAIGPVDAQALSTAVSGDVTQARAGDLVSVFVNGRTFTATVDLSGHYSVDVATTDLIADTDRSLDVVLSASDAAGNLANASASRAYTVDIVAPVVQSLSIDKSSLKVGETATVGVVFSEKVTAFDVSDITAANGSLSQLLSSDGGTTWSAIFTPSLNIEDSSYGSPTVRVALRFPRLIVEHVMNEKPFYYRVLAIGQSAVVFYDMDEAAGNFIDFIGGLHATVGGTMARQVSATSLDINQLPTYHRLAQTKRPLIRIVAGRLLNIYRIYQISSS
jgi:hypothetical protein